MFEGDLATLTTRDLLKSCADTHAAEHDAAARQLEHAVEYADRFHPDAVADRADCAARVDRRAGSGRVGGGRERAVVLGGDGCPPVLEFCVSEFGAVLGVSPGVARDRIATALALRSRFPFIWARVLDRKATAWKARNLARDCEKLSLEAALSVDSEVAPILDTISPTRLSKIIKAAKIRADPVQAKQEAEEKAKERGVWMSHTDEHGTKTAVIKASSADVRRHYAGINEIADALLILGDKRGVDARRATAVGIMPDRRFAEALLAKAHAHRQTTPTPASDPTPSPHTTPAPGPARFPDPTPSPGTASTRAPARFPDPSPAGPADLAPASHAPHSAAAASAPRPTPAVEGEGETAAEGRARAGTTAGGNLPLMSCDERHDDWGDVYLEHGPDDEADRDAPHPSLSDLPDPLDEPSAHAIEPFDTATGTQVHSDRDGEPMTVAEQRELTARLAEIKRDAYTPSTNPHDRSALPRPGKTEVYVHLTDHTLATGTGVIRVEEIGPLLAAQFTETVGYGPYVVKPVIDLNKAISSDAYETTNQIREHVKLAQPVEQFPYGTRETTNNIDLDHITPYDPQGPPGQTNTQNLVPLSRYGHRVKTHAHGWKVRRLDPTTLEWTTPHGFVFRVDPTGTHRADAGAT